MTLEFSLSEDDYLEHLLFTASKSPRIRKQLRKSVLTVSILFLVIAFLNYYSGGIIGMYIFICLSGLSIYFYPFYIKAVQKRAYKKYLKENLSTRFDQHIKLIFQENMIETFDITGESKLNFSEIMDIYETGRFYYIRLNYGANLIIPKEKLKDPENLRRELQRISDKLNVDFITELNWKW